MYIYKTCVYTSADGIGKVAPGLSHGAVSGAPQRDRTLEAHSYIYVHKAYILL